MRLKKKQNLEYFCSSASFPFAKNNNEKENIFSHRKAPPHRILITDQYREAEISQTVGCICRSKPLQSFTATTHR
jgi:hypothetical protein